ncbi:M16 family metallopeptidase [Myxacorys almedinensis]|uniref:Insulinase family protein n=1 Tax=Myxacorys almedinensis A TaxID=2690445 RepID=A0A8J8CM08_9CYAN|nr:pitrilysin family protein [Myxacorys almedinensis]NDJ16727.1 insulinase family protein [Myxacorys almedinensis A]
MSFLTFLRRYRLPSLLFALCLSTALLTGEVPLLEAANAVEVPATPLTTQSVRKTVLENGLTVLTKEVPTAPVVTVQVWYRLGSRDEARGVNGIAHQLEHLMFKGTQDRPIQFGRLFNALGSQSNAFTSYDQTAYFGTVERDKLRSLLALEADRMQGALMTADALKSENRVVISELQGYENSPSYRLSRAVMKAAMPTSPYGLPVGGTKADVEKFTIEQIRSYYQNYYSPNNATLLIVGDFQTEPTLKAVEDLFGKVPNRGRAAQAATDTPMAQAQIPQRASEAQKANSPNNAPQNPVKSPIVLREPGSAFLMQAVYPLPAAKHADVPAINVLDSVLTQGRSSRFYQTLVEGGLASDFSGYAATMISDGWYHLSATAAPEQTLTKLSQAVESVLADIRSKGVTPEELQRAKTQLRSYILLRNRDVTSQAFQLGDDQTTTGDYQRTDRLLAAIETVSAADIQRVAKAYFTPEKLTLGYFEPSTFDKTAGGTASPGQTTGQTVEQFNAGPPVAPSLVAKYLPAIAKAPNQPAQALPEKVVLPNGLRVLLLRDPSTPTVSLSAHVLAGQEFDRAEKSGLAKLTADNLTNGTTTKDALTLAKTLDDRGISFEISANRESVLMNGSALIEHLPILIQTMADVTQNASFPEQELELSRQRAITALKVQMDNPQYVARQVFQQTIYPENHPFHSFPTEASLSAIARQDLVDFHKAHYRPDTTIIALVGDFDPAAVKTLLQNELGNWKAEAKAPMLVLPTVAQPTQVVRRYQGIPGKTQSVTLLGNAGIDRKDPRFYNALVMNQILGGDTLSSRLGGEIRDRQGLTYGIYSYFQAGNRQGPFLVSMQTAPEDADKAIASTLKLLEQVRTQGIETAELTTAQRSLTSSYPVDLANPESLTNTILMNEVYGLNVAELRQYPNQIERVTQAQVDRAANELLHPDRIVVVTAGPPK